MSFPQAKRAGNPSSKSRKDSGHPPEADGMTHIRALYEQTFMTQSHCCFAKYGRVFIVHKPKGEKNGTI